MNRATTHALLAVMDIHAALAEASLLGDPTQPRPDIEAALADLGRALGAWRVRWMRYEPDTRHAHIAYAWCDDPTQTSAVGTRYATDTYPYIVPQLTRGEVAFCDAARPRPEQASHAALLRSEGMRCSAVTPVLRDGALVGAIGFAARRITPIQQDPRVWEGLRRLASLVFTLTQRRDDAARLRDLEARLRRRQRLETLGKLVSGVAHDVNNTLQILQVNLDLLDDGRARADATQRGAIDDMSEATEQTRDLIGRLLAFARDETLPPRLLHPGHTVAKTLKLIGRVLPEGVALDAHIDPHLDHVLIAPGDLEQALINLINNAADALPQSTGAVHVHVHVRQPDPHHILIEVHDDGHGMSTDHLLRATEPFFTTKPATQGTGLGLAMVAQMVQRAGGHFTLDSALGEGTVARLTLPISDAALNHDTDTAATTYRGDERLLLVEAQAVVARATADVLTRAGYRVHQAHTIATGRGAVSARACDLCVLGTLSPEGVAFAQDLLRDHPRLPLILTTGTPNLRLPQALTDAPHVAIIHKPYGLATLMRTARALLSDPL